VSAGLDPLRDDVRAPGRHRGAGLFDGPDLPADHGRRVGQLGLGPSVEELDDREPTHRVGQQLPSMPNPPAFVTAAARSGPATLDMPASCNGSRRGR
jgi:hypothetical protein